MKRLSVNLLLTVIMIITGIKYLPARTDITVTPAGGVSIPSNSTDSIENQVQDLSDKNGKFIANAFALANIQGYPIGKSTIGHFPQFEAGIGLGSGITNAKYFDDKAEDGTMPGIMFNPVMHFGFGLAGGFDIIGKIFYFQMDIYNPGLNYSKANLEDFNFISLGAKLRYNYIESATVIPLLLKFGGITLSIGADVLMGNVDVTGEYEATFNDITANVGGTYYPLNANLSSNYGATVSWTVFTITAQALTYFDIFYLFSVYTGFGLSANLGFFSTDFNGNGQLTTDNAAYITAKGDNIIGTMEFESVNSYMPSYLIPTYIFGVEINLWMIKLTADTMVNLSNGSDVTVQAGVRIQI